MNDNFSFISPGSRSTNITDMLILERFKDLNTTVAPIARKSHVSDTYALTVFDRYVNMKRLTLSKVLNAGEVYLEIPRECEYAFVLFDFVSRQPVDIIKSRKPAETEPYFASIPIEERVKAEYLSFAEKYFPKMQTIVDSFHVV